MAEFEKLREKKKKALERINNRSQNFYKQLIDPIEKLHEELKTKMNSVSLTIERYQKKHGDHFRMSLDNIVLRNHLEKYDKLMSFYEKQVKNFRKKLFPVDMMLCYFRWGFDRNFHSVMDSLNKLEAAKSISDLEDIYVPTLEWLSSAKTEPWTELDGLAGEWNRMGLRDKTQNALGNFLKLVKKEVGGTSENS